METDKCISTPDTATAKTQLTIDDLDDNSLGMIFNKLPYIDRMRIESVCQRWYAVSDANWSIYSKRLTIGEFDFLPSYNSITKREHILENILQQSGSNLEEIIFNPKVSFCERFPMGTIKWIAELCPKLKRLNTGNLMLNDDDWLACSNLEALSFFFIAKLKGDELSLLFRRNKKLRWLEIFGSSQLTASDFDHLDPGQLKSLHIEYCYDFELTAEVADKLAESLVELSYTVLFSTPKLQHLDKLKNLRFLDITVEMQSLESEFIADIAKNCRKLERLFLAIHSRHACNQNVFAPLFDLPYLRRLVILIGENEMPCEERDRLLHAASHLEHFVIDTCAKCRYGMSRLDLCYRHRRCGQRSGMMYRF